MVHNSQFVLNPNCLLSTIWSIRNLKATNRYPKYEKYKVIVKKKVKNKCNQEATWSNKNNCRRHAKFKVSYFTLDFRGTNMEPKQIEINSV